MAMPLWLLELPVAHPLLPLRPAQMNRVLAIALFAALAIAGLFSTVGATDPPAQTVTVTETVVRASSYQHRTAYWWAKRTWYWKRRSSGLRKTLRHDRDVVEAINLACSIYGNCATLWRKARCESHLFPWAYNQSSAASGLFQFLGSTWRSTPFGMFSVFSPYANALAAGWMHNVGRGGEWSCK